MKRLRAFVRLTRPLFLYGGFAGVALGAAVARHLAHPLDVGTYLWAQGLVSAFQLMVHYANDYFDRASDAHGELGRASDAHAAFARASDAHAVSSRRTP